MTLTVTERQHWKERIAQQIDKAITATYSLKDPGLLERIESEARKRAISQLGLDALLTRRQEVIDEVERLERENDDISRRLIAKVTGRRFSDVSNVRYSQSWLPSEAEAAIRNAATLIERQLLEENPLGQRVLLLRREKEELLDTVWLATSGRQIRELWTRVSDRLDQEPTPMQADALAITPMEEDS